MLTASSAARAASTEACLAAYERSQELRLNGKFEASREQLSQCVDESCPGLVRKDCSQWLGELDAAMPTIIFNARDAEGKDLVSARVRVDGNVMLEKLDGKPHPIDPGVHVFRYDLEGFEPSEETVVIQEAEKNRVLLAKLRRVPVASFVDPPRHDVAAGVLVGVGAIGVAGFAYLALSGLHDRDDLAARCAPHCPEGEVDAARKDRVRRSVAGPWIGLIGRCGVSLFLAAEERHGAPAGGWTDRRRCPDRSAIFLLRRGFCALAARPTL